MVEFFTMEYADLISEKLCYVFMNLWEIPFLIAGIITLFNKMEEKLNHGNASNSRLADEILELQNLVRIGLMSQDEYETKREELISRY